MARVRHWVGHHFLTLAGEDSDQIRQQKFLLRVVVGEGVEVGQEFFALKAKNAGVDFADVALGRGRHFLFHDSHHPAPLAHDSAVAGGVFDLGREHGGGGASAGVGGGQAFERLRGE